MPEVIPEITMHRFGVLIYDSKANVKALKGDPQHLDFDKITTFYGMSVYSIVDLPKAEPLNNVKKLAPDVSVETCSK
jgi:hypothetical protein